MSAVRSAVSIDAAGPRTLGDDVAGLAAIAVRRAHGVKTHAGIELAERLGGDVEAGDDAGALGEDDAAGAQRRRDGRLGRHVAPAEILGERAPHDLAIERRDRAARTAPSS